MSLCRLATMVFLFTFQSLFVIDNYYDIGNDNEDRPILIHLSTFVPSPVCHWEGPRAGWVGLLYQHLDLPVLHFCTDVKTNTSLLYPNVDRNVMQRLCTQANTNSSVSYQLNTSISMYHCSIFVYTACCFVLYFHLH